jgi:hypothetical protein
LRIAVAKQGLAEADFKSLGMIVVPLARAGRFSSPDSSRLKQEQANHRNIGKVVSAPLAAS